MNAGKGTHKRVLLTGGAGFIGSHLAEALLKNDFELSIIDNFDVFYDPEIKRNNIRKLQSRFSFKMFESDVCEINSHVQLKQANFDIIIHLASKAGVRKSVSEPEIYKAVNIDGTRAVYEYAKHKQIPQVIFASSSSVYGNHPEVPWKETLKDLNPLSPYARYKLYCEELGKEYADRGDFRFIALRFFSVYGPRMRPDLAIYRFSEKILKNEAIEIFGDGSSHRDYTYIGDIVDGLIKCMDYKQSGFEIMNLAYGQAVRLNEMIQLLEKHLDKKASKTYQKALKEESLGTLGDHRKAQKLIGFKPKTDIETGIKVFCKWYIQNKH